MNFYDKFFDSLACVIFCKHSKILTLVILSGLCVQSMLYLNKLRKKHKNQKNMSGKWTSHVGKWTQKSGQRRYQFIEDAKTKKGRKNDLQNTAYITRMRCMKYNSKSQIFNAEKFLKSAKETMFLFFCLLNYAYLRIYDNTTGSNDWCARP